MTNWYEFSLKWKIVLLNVLYIFTHKRYLKFWKKKKIKNPIGKEYPSYDMGILDLFYNPIMFYIFFLKL